MILSNRAVRKLLADGGVFIDPQPEEGQFDTSSLNLRVGAGEAQSVREAVDRIIAVIESEEDEREALLAERERIDARIAELQQS